MNRDWPTLSDIRATQTLLAPHLVRTPMVPWTSPTLARLLGEKTKPFLKLELFQMTGTFKARGALTWALSLNPEQRARGITAVSAGNHAIAAAFAAKAVGAPARIVVLKSADPPRDFDAFAARLLGCGNDLTEAAISVTPVIRDVLVALASLRGCALARLSGSGATCFGLFADEASAGEAEAALRAARPTWWVTAAPMARQAIAR